MRLLDFAWIIPALPALGAVVLLLFGKRLAGSQAGWLATATIGLSFVWSVVMFFALQSQSADHREHSYTLWQWFAGTGSFKVPFGVLVDPLSVTMILFVTGVGTLIHLYSIGYMHGDPRFHRFFAYLNLFAASMLILVLGSSFLVTFMGWEGVGLCSYLLISFWFERPAAALAGKKAFVTNRVGDVGFMLAMFLMFSKLGTIEYGKVFAGAPHLTKTTVTAIALLLFLGAVGKSAQFPLHIWLPDAMEGPTPVSALIHAATMVTAGVFLVCRAHVFYDISPSAHTVVAWIGAITALGAATVAVRQNDIKRVLAYSTLSQLGYMFMAAGVGAYGAAIFHMITHAFFKALLFLGSGAVIHGLHDEQDMRRMGQLRRFMPITAATFIVGWLAIAGVPPFAGFWSKDEILAKAWEYGGGLGKSLWAIGLVAALFTAFYMTRQVWLVFYGNARYAGAGGHGELPAAAHEAGGDQAAVHDAHDSGTAHDAAHDLPHESPPIMTFPLVVLAALSVIGGLLSLPFTKPSLEFLQKWLEPAVASGREIKAVSFTGGFALSTLAVVLGIIGIALGIALYGRGLPADGVDPAERRLGVLGALWQNAYYYDRGVSRAVSGPVLWFARTLSDGFDRLVIDGAVNGIGRVVKDAGGGLRRVQTGLVRNYALGIAAGTVLIIIFMVTRVG
jgi:NADH-quinone oxidoreductase subunit L